MPRTHYHADHPHVKLSPNAEDFLEHLYMREVEEYMTEITLPDDRVIGELLRHNHITLCEGRYALTPEGLRQAEQAVRRHRLAERLLRDVVAVHDQEVDQAACEFEHSLHHGIDEHVCTLLGHPKTCPHGRPIPPGRCCREHKGTASAAIVSLSDMRADERGSIAYLATREPEAMQKLMALGVIPGAPVTLIQTFPSVVFQVGQTQVALDTALARDIYVRRSG